MLNLKVVLDIQVAILSSLLWSLENRCGLLNLVVASIHIVFKTKRLDGIFKGFNVLG